MLSFDFYFLPRKHTIARHFYKISAHKTVYPQRIHLNKL